MGELALRRIQAGVETVRGAAVAATRRIYGVLEPKRDQPRRFAAEDRGLLVENFRANAKLVDAEFTLKSDALFEDLPYFLEMMNKGGVTPTGSAAKGYTYDYTPDMASDTLKTRTLEWGDEALAWQGPFATADTMKLEIGTDEVVLMELHGWVQEWFPTGRNGFTGFTGSIAERTVEGPNGWGVRLFIDTSSPIGTTYVASRFIKATAEYKNNNKRKYFGDLGPFFTKIGRGKRAVTLALEVEEQYAADYAISLNELAYIIDTNINGHAPQTMRIRLQVVGSQIAGSTFGTMKSALGVASTKVADLAGAKTAAGGPYTSAAIDAALYEVPTGASLQINADTIVTTAPVHVGDVTIAFASFTPSADWADESNFNAVAPYTWISATALTNAIPGGAALVLGDQGPAVTVTPAGAAAAATTVPIVPFTPRQAIVDAATIYRAKSVEMDFYGVLMGDPKWGANGTNVTLGLELKAVYEVAAGKAEAITVTNQNATATP
jgi:hypothetical protein